MTEKNYPTKDGKEHINIYTKGETELGRLMSNLSNLKINIPQLGKFKTLEGYWYFLKIEQLYIENNIKNFKNELKIHLKNLQNTNGFQSKKYGKKIIKESNLEFKSKEIPEEFKSKIKKAIQLKIKQNIKFANMLRKSNLPFEHYYYYGQKENAKIIFLNQYDWIIEEYERLRKILQEIKK